MPSSDRARETRLTLVAHRARPGRLRAHDLGDDRAQPPLVGEGTASASLRSRTTPKCFVFQERRAAWQPSKRGLEMEALRAPRKHQSEHRCVVTPGKWVPRVLVGGLIFTLLLIALLVPMTHDWAKSYRLLPYGEQTQAALHRRRHREELKELNDMVRHCATTGLYETQRARGVRRSPAAGNRQRRCWRRPSQGDRGRRSSSVIGMTSAATSSSATASRRSGCSGLAARRGMRRASYSSTRSIGIPAAALGDDETRRPRRTTASSAQLLHQCRRWTGFAASGAGGRAGGDRASRTKTSTPRFCAKVASIANARSRLPALGDRKAAATELYARNVHPPSPARGPRGAGAGRATGHLLSAQSPPR